MVHSYYELKWSSLPPSSLWEIRIQLSAFPQPFLYLIKTVMDSDRAITFPPGTGTSVNVIAVDQPYPYNKPFIACLKRSSMRKKTLLKRTHQLSWHVFSFLSNTCIPNNGASLRRTLRCAVPVILSKNAWILCQLLTILLVSRRTPYTSWQCHHWLDSVSVLGDTSLPGEW